MLKSISGRSQQAGFKAEAAVIRLLVKNNFQLLFQRVKTRISEIDLIFEKDNLILLIEVKTLNSSWRAFDRIGKKQLAGLRANRQLFLRTFGNKKTQAYLAWVSEKNEISFCSPD